MIPGSANPLLLKRAAAAGGYTISRSLRFNSSDSGFLSRTPASAGNRKTWTYSFWFKLGRTTGYQYFISANNPSGGGSNYDILQMDNNASTIAFFGYNGSSFAWRLSSTAVFRDPSAWQHFVIAFDTTQATASNRVKWWHNGNLLALDRSGNTTYPSLNADSRINDTVSQRLSDQAYGLNSYLADIHFIDGQALTPGSFGEFDTNNVWQPKAYTGTYGTNGFHLDFADNSAATATTLGKDTSGNGNNWTPTNLSVTAGAGNDSLVDSPTNYGTDTGAGGEVRGNYCTWNSLNPGGVNIAYSNGNLDFSRSDSLYWRTAYATFGVSSGKWYWETIFSSVNVDGAIVGIAQAGISSNAAVGENSTSYGYYSVNGNKYNSGVSTSYSSSWAAGDVIGVAFDADNGTVTFYKNGASQGTAYSSIPVGTYFPANSVYATGACSANFGQRPFAYTAPSGFKALCTANLPTPTIADGSTVMDVKLYTGNGSTQTISGLNFSPDLVWIKERNAVADHALYDIVRGTQNRLESNTTDAAATSDNGLTAFNSDGFALGSLAQVNTNADTYAAWCWDAGTSTVTNTQGSITSTVSVRANASAGFSVVTYTGTGVNCTVGHGLGVAPGMIIVKRRDTTSNWQVRHTSIAAANSIQLNLTNAAASATTVWNSTAPTSTVFSIGTDASVNASGGTYVAYCFAPQVGYSSGFSYTGNGSTDGVFQFLGFRPRLILLKRTDTTGNWTLIDTAREGYNVDNDPLYPNLADAEGTADLLDITSNGFKLRSTDASVNANTGTYVGFAWAETPFAYSRAR